MFVEEIVKKVNGKEYRTVLVRESFRVGATVHHRTLANLSKLPRNVINAVKEQLTKTSPKEKTSSLDISKIQILNSREYGASKSALEIAKQIGLIEVLFSKKQQWREDALAMIIGRLVYPGSKLGLVNVFADTVLWDLCGHRGRPDVKKNCYASLDRLLDRQNAIQNKLAHTHLKEGCVVLYDITSSYFEGEYENSELVTFGYNRDKKRGHEQVNIGLLTNEEGCPIAVETFRGNVPDQVTVKGQVEKITKDFKTKEVVFVGDRGMLTPKRIQEVQQEGFKIITALTHEQMQTLLNQECFKIEDFKKGEFPEFADPKRPGMRYILCLNPKRKQEETDSRNELIAKAEEKLCEINKNSKKGAKDSRSIEAEKMKMIEQEICAKVGTILKQYRVKKFFSWSVREGVLTFSKKQDIIDREARLDGCYVIQTDVTSKVMTAEGVVETYKKLAHVEKAFRVIKTTALEIRPVYHHLDHRIRGHIFLCMLAYYLQWHMVKRLETIFQKDGKGKNRRWSFCQILESLKSIRSQTIRLGSVEIEGMISTPTREQEELLSALGIKM